MNRLVRVGIIGDFKPGYAAHMGTNEALDHAAKALSLTLDRSWLATESLDDDAGETVLKQCDALWCAPGSPYQSMSGAFRAVRFARERDWPFIAT